MNAVLSNSSPTYASKPYIKSKNTNIYKPQLNSGHCANFNKFIYNKNENLLLIYHYPGGHHLLDIFLAQNNIKAQFV